MALATSTLSRRILAVLLFTSACAADDGDANGGDDQGAATDTGATDDDGPTTGVDGDTDDDTTGDPPVACDVDVAATVDFTVEVDGAAVWVDDRILDLAGSWELTPAPNMFYDIDADCDTIGQEGDTVTLQCPDAEDTTHEIAITLGAEPAVALATLPATVHLRYVMHYGTAEFGNPDIAGHAFVLTDGDALVAAGVLARSELSRWGALEAFGAAVGWEDAPLGCDPRFDIADACWGLQPLDMQLSIGDASGTVRSGAAATVGTYEALLARVERAVTDPDVSPDASGGEGCASFELHHALVVGTP